MLKAYKYRVYPTKAQALQLSQHFGCARHVYNWALAAKEKYYRETGKSLSKRAIQDAMVLSKKTEFPWLREVNSQSLLASLDNLERAFAHFFSGRSKFPRYKKKYSGWQSFQCPQHVKVDAVAGVIDLPKIKEIKAKLHRPLSGKIKTVTIKRNPSGHYFASILVEDERVLPIVSPIIAEQTVGLDVGLTHVLIDSEGNKTNNPRFMRNSLYRLGVEQKKLARQKKGSANRAKQRRKVALLHEKTGNRRHDFIHQETAKLVVKNHATSFAVEDLHIKGMVKNRKLSRAIHDVSWGKFLTVLAYKCERYGKNLITINRFAPSSKLCHDCGYYNKAMPLSVREWACPSCLTVHDRDINAAKNIRLMGLADSPGHGDCVKSPSAAILVSASATAKGVERYSLRRSQEAPTRVA
jgi:putative transposase